LQIIVIHTIKPKKNTNVKIIFLNTILHNFNISTSVGFIV